MTSRVNHQSTADVKCNKSTINLDPYIVAFKNLNKTKYFLLNNGDVKFLNKALNGRPSASITQTLHLKNISLI